MIFLYLYNLFISLIKLKNIYQKHTKKEQNYKFKIDKITYSKSPSRKRITLPKISLHCILKIFFALINTLQIYRVMIMLQEINIKIRTCHYIDDIINFEGFGLDNIWIDKNDTKSIFGYHISYKLLIGAKPYA